jgi:hypothetical protein
MVVRLTDGTRVVIRPIRPSDSERIGNSRDRFSDESMRRRFLTPKPRLTSSELRYLTEVDGQDHYALVATPLDDLDAIVATTSSRRGSASAWRSGWPMPPTSAASAASPPRCCPITRLRWP